MFIFRINILFTSCGHLYLHRAKWNNFAEHFTERELATKIERDINNCNVMLLVQCVGLIGKLDTGPWMSHFYGNCESKYARDTKLHVYLLCKILWK